MANDPTKEHRTDRNAKPVRERNVQNKRVVHLTGATYRDAVFDGTFEVAMEQQGDMPDADGRVICNVLWHGWKPGTGAGLQIQVKKGGWRFESGYTGPVVAEVA